jgi:hypothetical protein
MTTLGLSIFGLIATFLVIMYCINIYRIFQDISGENYSFKMLVRVGGVFFPVLGVFMGFIS